ncbi:PspC domain-containing protein [Glaciibacter psychrotolerans]|uniref:Phage shock protein PspC (Stress-responsive transcriptional regulator) n=1 Tax=Glaciibacter psychrotolerans TaxID=670054 RepID=A0A7Z0EFE9_9MICO|nr:PspC domain-containing protein [Leifsonia psychrotolerans]NYJ20682.1 phage shock protein PspC (stress-responsive transcriptional regulator) [Leifsonia psychrotolerans]
MNDAPHHPPTHPPAPQVTRFFDWIRSTGIDRGHDRWFAGVCGGIAHRTGLDPLIIRGIALVLAVLGGPALFAYALGWALLPNASGRIHVEQAFRGVFEPAMIAIGALILFTVFPFARGLWWQGAPLAWGMPDWLAVTFTIGWSIAVTVFIVWVVIFLLRRIPASDSAFRGASAGAPAAGSASTGMPPTGPRTSFVTTPSAQTDAAAPAAPAAAAAASHSVVWESTAAGTATAPGPAVGAAIPAAPTGTVPPVPPLSPVPPAAQRSAWDALLEQKNAVGEAARTHDRHDHRPHPGAGFTAIALGLALALGSSAAAVYSGAFAGGIWSNSALLIGLSFTLGILALGVIVSGIRGRSSGALGGFAFLAAAALVVLGVLPPGTQYSIFGSPTWTVSASAEGAPAGYAMLAGNPTVDLRALDRAALTVPTGEPRVIDVWLGFGQTELVLPNNSPVTIEVNVLAGAVDYEEPGSNRADVARGGIFVHDVRTFNGTASTSVPTIRVWTLAGQVTVEDPRN